MMTAITPVDIDHLRRALLELGYKEALPVEAAPLVHHILADLSQSTKQYNDLLGDYDELFGRWKEQQSALDRKATLGNKNSMDLTHITGLDSSLLGIPGNLDDSLILQTVEHARARIESLEIEKSRLNEERSKLISERDSLAADVHKSQLAAQELSQLLQAKHSHLDSLQRELEKLKKKDNSMASLQATALLKNVISLLPAQLQPGLTAEISNTDSIEHILSLVDKSLQRLRREFDDKEQRLQSVQASADNLSRQHKALEETMASMRGGIAQYQNQIAELNSRLNQREFERNLQSDMQSQIATLEGMNNMIRDKLQVLEQLKQGMNGQPGGMTEVTVKALLESLTSELHTEIGFSTHLSQMVEKLNNRRSEQDRDIFALNQKLADSESRMSKLEVEKAEIRAQMERLSANLLLKDQSIAASNETAANMQQTLQNKQKKIEEHKKYCTELKAALDQCQVSMTGMRRNEEVIRKHVASQDQEIRRLRGQYELSMREKANLVQRATDLEAQMVGLRNNLKERTDEHERLKIEVKEVLLAKERAVKDLKSVKDNVIRIEENLAARRREKELVMANCCRLMEDNKRLHSEVQKLNQICASSRSGDAALQAFQSRIEQQTGELATLKSQLSQAEARIVDMEGRLSEALSQKGRLQDELANKDDKISNLKGEVMTLERSKRDITAQMSRFAQQANELKSHLRRVEAERIDLEAKLQGDSHGSPAALDLKRHLAHLSSNLEKAQSQLRTLERERDMLNEEIKAEKSRAMRMEERCNHERAKLVEQQSTIDGLESARDKLKHQLDLINKKNNEGVVEAIRRQMLAAKEEMQQLRDDSFERERSQSRGRRSRRHLADETPSPPDSPVELYDEPIKTTDRLKIQNKALKDELLDIRDEVKRNLSPSNKLLNADLDSSLTLLTSDDQQGDTSSSPSSDEIMASNADMRRKLEQENRLLFKIVEKVKSELQRASMETPTAASTRS